MIESIKYAITKSRRRHNFSAQVLSDGSILFSVPSVLNKREINTYLLEQKDWIKNQLITIKKRKKEEEKFIKKNTFFYLGEGYEKVYVKALKKEGVEVRSTRAIIYLKNRSNEKLVLEKFYRANGVKWIEKMKEKWYPLFERKPISIKMRRQKSVWGTCNLKGLINLNIQLIKGPIEIFEYVFVHEMCHLIEANHRSIFWKTMEEFMPDYKLKREWLRINGHFLFL